ncbi:MAG: hypothetical protein ACUZ8I_14285 [Candidatus Scalindua sp.]
MGYSTDFTGEFTIDKPVDDDTYRLLKGLATTRRMKRSGLEEELGKDGEFYFEDVEDFGQSQTPKYGEIVDFNKPPETQPSLWLHWLIQEDRQTIIWDEGEKFYHYTRWIEYLIDRILKPRGYIVNGKVEWNGDEHGDFGLVDVKDNVVTAKPGKIVYE